ncbi:hypothetical protein GCM10009836_33180 [Pseudonocardia ailaonensis]|uniref:Uncharacterized protein n=1 Tax=Pseudonocardia ailaonensis TaxID=367279 RepID=A0ABN2N3N1_9PSEU
MTDSAQPTDSGPAGGDTGPRQGAPIIDVLMRGLVAARDTVGPDVGVEPDSLFCAGLYYDGQHYCPVLYIN